MPKAKSKTKTSTSSTIHWPPAAQVTLFENDGTYKVVNVTTIIIADGLDKTYTHSFGNGTGRIGSQDAVNYWLHVSDVYTAVLLATLLVVIGFMILVGTTCRAIEKAKERRMMRAEARKAGTTNDEMGE